jgi:geranylgeranyl pyrophosphate synthase
LETAFGQQLDLQQAEDEETYWQLVQTKSSPFFSAAFYIGALVGGASEETACQFEELGRLYGEMIQIHDDLNDVMTTPADPDWLQGRSPLPILFAQVVAHPERERFVELRQIAAEPAALAEAQAILIRCGAVSYCVDQLIRRYHAAQGVLGGIRLVQDQELANLFESLVEPIWKLLEEVGVTNLDTMLTPQTNAPALNLLNRN